MNELNKIKFVEISDSKLSTIDGGYNKLAGGIGKVIGRFPDLAWKVGKWALSHVRA